MSFSTAVRPVLECPSHPVDEDAVDLTETIDISGPTKGQLPTLRQDIVQADELYPPPADFVNRVRRPSVIRVDSDATITSKDTSQPQMYVAEEVDKEMYTTISLPHVGLGDKINADAVNSEVVRKQKKGWNDGTTGPLIPVIQEYYHLNFTVVSLLFVFNCIGFILGAGLNVWLNHKIGFGKTLVIGSLFQLAAYAIQCPAPPFPVMVFAHFLAGLGMSMQNAQCNGFVGSLKRHQTTKLGVLHASYGAGAFVAPLVATQFSSLRHWSYHFLISMGIAVSNTTALVLVFRFRRQEDVLAEAGQEPDEAETRNEITGQGLYRAIFGIKAVHYFAFFAFIYIGTEVTLGGWIVTFIINERGGGKSAGYISSGFFGGLTLGRLALMGVSEKIGEHRVVFIYAILAIALEFTVWFVPSIIENAVAISFIGMLLGPMFPILVGHAARILPAWLLTATVGWITGIGVSGSAALPFITGVLASKFGIRSLQPLVVSMMCTMVGVWALVPRTPRRVD